MRPLVSVAGTRCTRCTPLSNLQARISAAPADLGDRSPCSPPTVPSLATAPRRFHPLRGRVARVHAEEIASEERGLIAARAGAHLEDGAFLIGFVLRQQHQPYALPRAVEPRQELRLLRQGKLAHLGIDRGLGQHRFRAGKLRLGRAQFLDRGDDRLQLRQLAGQLDRFRGRRVLREAKNDRGVAGQDGVELCGRKIHGEAYINARVASSE